MESGKGSFFMLISSVIILLLGYFAFGAVTSSISETNSYNNATISSVNTVTGIVPLILIVMSIMVILVLVRWYVDTEENYNKGNKIISKILTFLDKTTFYFAFGLFSYAIFGTIAVSIYLLFRLSVIAGESGVGFEIGKWIVIAISFYFGTALIGYLFHKYIWFKITINFSMRIKL